MNKFCYSTIFIFLCQPLVQGCESQINQQAKIIKGAAYYHLHSAGFEHINEGFSRQPLARFHDKNGKSIGAIELESPYKNPLMKVEAWRKEKINELDQRIDTQTALEKPITSVKIGSDLKWEGFIEYFYEDGKIMDTQKYTGSLDIKNSPNHKKLIKPHSLLKDIKKVTQEGNFYLWRYPKKILFYKDKSNEIEKEIENDYCIIPRWLYPKKTTYYTDYNKQQIDKIEERDYFIAPFLIQYHKKTITYQSDNQKKEEICLQHKAANFGRVAIGLGILYGAYAVISKFFDNSDN